MRHQPFDVACDTLRERGHRRAVTGVAKLRQNTAELTGKADLTMSGMMLGTPIYMSPEQCQGEPLDARSDIYSLGCVFYEMLAGRTPFLGSTASQLIVKHASEAPKDPSGSTVVALYRLFASKEEVARMEEEHRAGGVGYGTFKQRLFETMWEHFAPMRARRAELLARPGYVDDVLADGARRAREIGGETMARVRKAIGLD